MLRSLFSGVSGMRAHQTMLDVVGNNIANVNTVGYKASSVEFEDTLSQALKAAGAPQNGQGGTNPAQVGLGVQTAAINTSFTQGSAEATGVATDLMIQGDGFFVVNHGGQQVYTRNGAFTFDAKGNLTTANGALVQGWTAVGGVVNTSGAVGAITLPIGASLAPMATKSATIAGNLPADGSGAPPTNDLKVYDTKGQLVEVTLSYAYDTATNTWSLNYTDPSTGSPPTTQKATDLSFDANGTLTTASPLTVTLNGQSVDLDISGITAYGGTSTVQVVTSSGNAMGSLSSYSISPDGTIQGLFSNGLKEPLGQIAMATFNNPGGLSKVGNSEYAESVNSGQAQIGVSGTGSLGQLAGGQLEGSNVDLSQEFSNLIIAQRGFEANAKVITTSDEVLQDLVNLKH